MKSVFALLAGIVCVFLTCEKNSSGLQISPANVMSATLPDTVRLGQPIPFEVACGTPTPCWTFSRFDITQTEHHFTINVLAEYDGRPCIQMLGSFTASGSVAPKERGIYTFEFRRTQTASLTKTVVVK